MPEVLCALLRLLFDSRSLTANIACNLISPYTRLTSKIVIKDRTIELLMLSGVYTTVVVRLWDFCYL